MEINHGSFTSHFSTSRDNGFSFHWKIERFSTLTPGSLITSPDFYLTKRTKNLHWYLEFKVEENWDRYSTLRPILYQLNLCNKDEVNIGIDFTMDVILNQEDLPRKRFDSIESFRILKKVNLLPRILFPLLCKDDFINFACSIRVKCGPGMDWIPHRPIKLPAKNSPSVLRNDHKITLHQPHNTSVRAKLTNKQSIPNQIRKPTKNSTTEVAICNSKQTQTSQAVNTDEISEVESLKQLSIDLKRILIQAMNTDVTIRVEDTTIKAHKTILCARSQVFCSMFEHSTLEAAHNEIEVTDIRASVMKKLINYLYSGEKDRLQYEDACELYYAADKYEILYLREACMKDLLCLLDVSNACPMLSLAYRHSDDVFKEQIMDFISKNFNSIVNTEAWIELTDNDTRLAALLVRYCAGAITNNNVQV
ncbi:TD and POZ domain-containing protein 4-like isoform X1 [Parasteatoda tepidariorum]|uniref:TD and POZ domain-containing protein 4-like isoform X1 n=1 Tax=Parasteatoda tepidariorum TaxID=114398 RepID=UPI001C717DD8|nr:TD and POZ domain-containing protein 4-like isoform X1 [Parasteatoda tepidariorum]XP_042911605.1 TD and POZ domain-containing protein 4-like isoform X2 [Parasteatoda tepidariorum]